MDKTLYLLFQVSIIVLVLGLLVLMYLGLRHGLRQLNSSEGQVKKYLYYVLVGTICWLLILAGLASLDFFTDFQQLPPRIFLAFVPPFMLMLCLVFSSKFTRLLQHIPPAWLIYIQSFRLLMELSLWLGFLAGAVPFQMTFEGFNFDIVTGVTALLAAPLFFGRGRFLFFETIIWNISGMLLLFNIVLISIISTPSPLRIFFNEPANTMIANFPFIWIPGFIVPFALAMHLFSIRQMIASKRARP